jgi:predicted RNase H-like HicB family nuclease
MGEKKMNQAAEYLKKPYGRMVVPEADGTFRGQILEFPGCIAVGDTPAEALANLEDVAESWIESLVARGQPVPQPMDAVEYSGKLVVRLPKRLHRKAALMAQADGTSLNQFILSSIAEAVGEKLAERAAQDKARLLVEGAFINAGDLATSMTGPMVTAFGSAPSWFDVLQRQMFSGTTSGIMTADHRVTSVRRREKARA